MCIDQLPQTSFDTSEDTSLGMETQTNVTPEEIILSELQVSKHIIGRNQRWSDYNTNVLTTRKSGGRRVTSQVDFDNENLAVK